MASACRPLAGSCTSAQAGKPSACRPVAPTGAVALGRAEAQEAHRQVLGLAEHLRHEADDRSVRLVVAQAGVPVDAHGQDVGVGRRPGCRPAVGRQRGDATRRDDRHDSSFRLRPAYRVAAMRMPSDQATGPDRRPAEPTRPPAVSEAERPGLGLVPGVAVADPDAADTCAAALPHLADGASRRAPGSRGSSRAPSGGAAPRTSRRRTRAARRRRADSSAGFDPHLAEQLRGALRERPVRWRTRAGRPAPRAAPGAAAPTRSVASRTDSPSRLTTPRPRSGSASRRKPASSSRHAPSSSTGATTRSASGARQDGSGHTAVKHGHRHGQRADQPLLHLGRQASSWRSSHSCAWISICAVSWSRHRSRHRLQGTAAGAATGQPAVDECDLVSVGSREPAHPIALSRQGDPGADKWRGEIVSSRRDFRLAPTASDPEEQVEVPLGDRGVAPDGAGVAAAERRQHEAGRVELEHGRQVVDVAGVVA